MNKLKPAGVVSKALLATLKENFALSWDGIHGVRHWGRVRTNGLLLAEATGANARVAELFAVLHDSCRWNDGHDPSHGLRGAEMALDLNGRFFNLSDGELELLLEACIGHSDGNVEADITVQICWDADRLDLGRVGIRPLPGKLCTKAARNPAVIQWAYSRSGGSARDELYG